MRAIWHGKVIVESEDAEFLGGSYYFPVAQYCVRPRA
jgi:hypothetical protein